MTLQILELQLQPPAGVKLSQSAGSLFHGVLMENIDTGYAEYLHGQGLRPYSQYLFFDKKRNGLFWRIAALNQEAKQELLSAAFALPEEVFLKQKGFGVNIVSKSYLQTSDYDALAEKYFAADFAGKFIELSFLTSCSFKSNGSYVIFPQQQQLFGSLIRKWNSFAATNRLDEDGLAEALAQETFVADYRLGLQPFALEGTRVPAFRGMYRLGLKNNLMSNRIIAMLCDFAQYSGIGIKNSLGMGAVAVSITEAR